MSERLQSPEISSALRDALSLDGAGSIPLEMADTVVPVALVADVRDLLANNQIPVAHFGIQSPGVAGQRSYAVLEWQAFQNPNPRRILVDEVQIWSSTAQLAYVGLVQAPLAGAATLGARRKFSDVGATMAARVIVGTSANAPLVLSPFSQLLVRLTGGDPLTIAFKDPQTLTTVGHGLIVVCENTNTDLLVSMQWREDYRD